MPTNSKQKKHPKPVRVRGKVNVHQPIDKKLTKSQSYIQAQSNADPQNMLATQAGNLVKTRTALMDVIKKRDNIKAHRRGDAPAPRADRAPCLSSVAC